jgi:hypothetical protein
LPAEKESKRRIPRRREVCGEQEKWETARRDAWLRKLLTDRSESEPEDEYTRFEESSRWIAEMTGGAAEEGPRGAGGEDFIGDRGHCELGPREINESVKCER